MSSPAVSRIKRAQKEAQILRTVQQLFHQTSRDDKALGGLTITRASLSDDKSFCTLYFYTDQGEAAFKEMLKHLKLYKPSLRKALSQALSGRYTCDLKFTYDDQFEKIERIEKILNSIS